MARAKRKGTADHGEARKRTRLAHKVVQPTNDIQDKPMGLDSPKPAFGNSDGVQKATSSDTRNVLSAGRGIDLEAATDALETRPANLTTMRRKTSFTYQPLEDYQKAEALRILFLKCGLDYLKPDPSLSRFNEETLAPYIAQWAETLRHWYPILGIESPDKKKPPSFRLPDPNVTRRLSAARIFGHNRSPTDLSPRARFPSLNSSSADCSERLDLHQSIDTKPLFIPTVARWASTVPTQAQNHSMLWLNPKPSSGGSVDKNLNIQYVPSAQNLFSSGPGLDAKPTLPEQPRDFMLRRHRGHFKCQSGRLDDSTEVPEMFPVHRLADGTLEYVDGGNVNTSQGNCS